jgi:hypothetical protein
MHASFAKWNKRKQDRVRVWLDWMEYIKRIAQAGAAGCLERWSEPVVIAEPWAHFDNSPS